MALSDGSGTRDPAGKTPSPEELLRERQFLGREMGFGFAHEERIPTADGELILLCEDWQAADQNSPQSCQAAEQAGK